MLHGCHHRRQTIIDHPTARINNCCTMRSHIYICTPELLVYVHLGLYVIVVDVYVTADIHLSSGH